MKYEVDTSGWIKVMQYCAFSLIILSVKTLGKSLKCKLIVLQQKNNDVFSKASFVVAHFKPITSSHLNLFLLESLLKGLLTGDSIITGHKTN